MRRLVLFSQRTINGNLFSLAIWRINTASLYLLHLLAPSQIIGPQWRRTTSHHTILLLLPLFCSTPGSSYTTLLIANSCRFGSYSYIARSPALQGITIRPILALRLYSRMIPVSFHACNLTSTLFSPMGSHIHRPKRHLAVRHIRCSHLRVLNSWRLALHIGCSLSENDERVFIGQQHTPTPTDVFPCFFCHHRRCKVRNDNEPPIHHDMIRSFPLFFNLGSSSVICDALKPFTMLLWRFMLYHPGLV